MAYRAAVLSLAQVAAQDAGSPGPVRIKIDPATKGPETMKNKDAVLDTLSTNAACHHMTGNPSTLR